MMREQALYEEQERYDAPPFTKIPVTVIDTRGPLGRTMNELAIEIAAEANQSEKEDKTVNISKSINSTYFSKDMVNLPKSMLSLPKEMLVLPRRYLRTH